LHAICGPSATLEAVEKRMQRSRCGKKAAKALAAAKPKGYST